jgi:hypothetical protein
LLEAPKELIVTALELERSEGAVIADKVGDTACTFLGWFPPMPPPSTRVRVPNIPL